MTMISVLGSGWLGAALIEQLVSDGYRVKASTTSENRLNILSDLNVEPFIINIDKLPANIQSFLESETLIINIPSKNIDGFQNLLKAIEKSRIKNVLFISSTSVYAANNQKVHESDNSELKDSLLFQIENIFRSSAHISTTILRFAGLIGYNRHPGNFFAKGKTVKAPDAFVNLIHQDDCIAIIRDILDKKIWRETFNCCADTHPTKRDFYTKSAQSIGRDIPSFENTTESPYKIISNQKIKRALNYQFKYADLIEIDFSLPSLK